MGTQFPKLMMMVMAFHLNTLQIILTLQAHLESEQVYSNPQFSIIESTSIIMMMVTIMRKPDSELINRGR